MVSANAAPLTSSELIIDATTGLVSVYTANSDTVGSHLATVTASLVSYTGVSPITYSFTV